MTEFLTFILRTISIEYIKYLPISVDIVEKNRVNSGEHRNIKKLGNEIIEILIMSKSRNLPKPKSKYLFKSKKIQNDSTTKERNFLTFNSRVSFTKLRQAFTKISIL